MFSQVAYMDFKQKSTTFPWLRASILSCQLSAPKCQDGIGKCLGRHEVDKLKSNQNKTMVLEAENFLTNHWDQLSAMADGKGHGPEGLSIMGRCMIRVALHLTKKESKGRDTTRTWLKSLPNSKRRCPISQVAQPCPPTLQPLPMKSQHWSQSHWRTGSMQSFKQILAFSCICNIKIFPSTPPMPWCSIYRNNAL